MSPSSALRGWARRHSYSLFSSLGALWGHPLGTAMTVLVLGIAMLLPLGLYLALENLGRLELDGEDWGAVTVFLAPEAGAERAEALAAGFEARADVAEVRRISPEQGMEEFRRASGFGPALDALDANPLPWVLVLTPATPEGGDGLGGVEQLVDAVQQADGVEHALYDRKWLERLARGLELGRALASVLSLLFALAVAVVVANTIRLDVAARTEEIEVLALVGAGNAFIRLPFLYAGFWYGLLGALLALLLLRASLAWLQGPLERLLATYGTDWSPVTPGLSGAGLLLLAGGLLGLGGAWLAVRRHLRRLRVGGRLGRR